MIPAVRPRVAKDQVRSCRHLIALLNTLCDPSVDFGFDPRDGITANGHRPRESSSCDVFVKSAFPEPSPLLNLRKSKEPGSLRFRIHFVCLQSVRSALPGRG